MTLRDHFPRAAAFAADGLDWGAPFDWRAPDIVLLDRIWTYQVGLIERAEVWPFTNALIDDLADARRAACGEPSLQAIDCVRFVTCMPAIFLTRRAGQWRPCFDWLWTAISATHDRTRERNENVSLFGRVGAAPRDLQHHYKTYVPPFAAAWFYIAYKLGGLDQTSTEIAEACFRISLVAAEADQSDPEAIEALVQIAIWAAKTEAPRAPAYAASLQRLAGPERPAERRKTLLMAFITPVHQFTEKSAKAWATDILATFDDVLVEHERLQLLAVIIDDPAAWLEWKDTALFEIARLRAFYLSVRGVEEADLEILESRVSILQPLVYSLINWGEVADLVELLTAWYRAPDAVSADADVLLIVPTHHGGAAYLWPGGRLLTGVGDAATHDAVQHALAPAIGVYMRGTDGDMDQAGIDAFNRDHVNAAHGQRLEAAMVAHYRFEDLANAVPEGWTPRAIVVLPSGAEPLQGMLAKYTKLRAPFETSFEQSNPSRAIRRVLVWAAGGLMHEQFELEALVTVAARYGLELSVHGSENPSLEAFQAFYEEETADVLWVISHGVHDLDSISGTGIYLTNDLLLSHDVMRQWRVPERGRRLLVLNSCSGATAQTRGGVARIGLAHSLVSADQMVIGHLWPVHWSTGLAFGATLAACLGAPNVEAAYFAAMAVLQDRDRLIAFVKAEFAGAELVERVERTSEDLGSLTAWGSSVLLT